MLLQIWENLSIKIDLFVCINLYMCYTIKKEQRRTIKVHLCYISLIGCII